MYEDAYDLKMHEQMHVSEILTNFEAAGGRLQDEEGNPLASIVVRGRRFLVCDKGKVWRYVYVGAPKEVKGPPWRSECIEMWTSGWQKVQDDQGQDRYSKCLIWAPISGTTNAHEGSSHIDWYTNRKGYKHPYDPPHKPTKREIAKMEKRRDEMDQAVYARMEEDAELTAPETAPEPEEAPKPKRKKRTNKRKPRVT